MTRARRPARGHRFADTLGTATRGYAHSYVDRDTNRCPDGRDLARRHIARFGPRRPTVAADSLGGYCVAAAQAQDGPIRQAPP